jgi:hypothetical protein
MANLANYGALKCGELKQGHLQVIFVSDEKLTLVDYPSNHDGVFQSWRERWSAEEAKEIDSFLATLTKKDDKHFNC